MSKLSIVRLGAVVCAAAFFAGCETSSNTESGQMGVVGGDAAACAKACSGEAKTECAAGAAKAN